MRTILTVLFVLLCAPMAQAGDTLSRGPAPA